MTSPYIRGLAAAASDLFLEGKNDPSCEEIIRKYFGGMALPGTSNLLTKGQIAVLQKTLNEDGHQVCPVTAAYYRKFRRNPKSADDVIQCLPIGSGKKTEGIRRIVGEPEKDIMWLAWMKLQTDRSWGAAVSVGEKINKAAQDGYIDSEQVEDLIGDKRSQIRKALPLPEDIEDRAFQLAKQFLAALPAAPEE